jgi:hypothetical protein
VHRASLLQQFFRVDSATQITVQTSACNRQPGPDRLHVWQRVPVGSNTLSFRVHLMLQTLMDGGYVVVQIRALVYQDSIAIGTPAAAPYDANKTYVYYGNFDTGPQQALALLESLQMELVQQ